MTTCPLVCLDVGWQPWVTQQKTKLTWNNFFLFSVTPVNHWLLWFCFVQWLLWTSMHTSFANKWGRGTKKGEKREKLEPLSHMTGICDFMSFTILGRGSDYLALNEHFRTHGLPWALFPPASWHNENSQAFLYQLHAWADLHKHVCILEGVLARTHTRSFTSHTSLPLSETPTPSTLYAPTCWSF